MRRRPARRVAYCVEALEVRFLLAATMPLDAASGQINAGQIDPGQAVPALMVPAQTVSALPLSALTVPTLIVPGSTDTTPSDLMQTGSGDGGALSIPPDLSSPQVVTGATTDSPPPPPPKHRPPQAPSSAEDPRGSSSSGGGSQSPPAIVADPIRSQPQSGNDFSASAAFASGFGTASILVGTANISQQLSALQNVNSTVVVTGFNTGGFRLQSALPIGDYGASPADGSGREILQRTPRFADVQAGDRASRTGNLQPLLGNAMSSAHLSLTTARQFEHQFASAQAQYTYSTETSRNSFAQWTQVIAIEETSFVPEGAAPLSDYLAIDWAGLESRLDSFLRDLEEFGSNSMVSRDSPSHTALLCFSLMAATTLAVEWVRRQNQMLAFDRDVYIVLNDRGRAQSLQRARTYE